MYFSLKEITEAPVAERTQQQKQVHKILEDIAANEDHKEWDVSQEDIHFAVHMFDRHDLVCTYSAYESQIIKQTETIFRFPQA